MWERLGSIGEGCDAEEKQRQNRASKARNERSYNSKSGVRCCFYHVKLSVGRGHNGESQAGTEARRCRVPSRLRVRGESRRAADVESERGRCAATDKA